jgi:hypothetical protein
MGQKQTKLPPRFEYFNHLPVELQIQILSYLPTKDLYHAVTVSTSFYHTINYYKLLSSRKIARKNRYCKYYTCDGKIIGLYIEYSKNKNCIYFTYLTCGGGVLKFLYKYDIRTKEVYDCMPPLPEKVSGRGLQLWKVRAQYDNPHEKHLRELFS